MVRIQAQTLRSTTLSLSALKRLAHPTPMMLVVIACVVLTGMPRLPVTASTLAAVVSAANPSTGGRCGPKLASLELLLQTGH